MGQEKLRRLMGSRSDGYWELLATAVGTESVVPQAIEGVSGIALAANVHGTSISPSMVEQRVQALAAYDLGRLADVSREWKPPSDLSPDLLDPCVDFWTAAWSSSLRFLVQVNAVPNLEGTLPLPLAREVDTLFGGEKLAIKTWEEFSMIVLDAPEYDALRALDRAEVSFKMPVTRAQVAELLGQRPSLKALERLRVLQNRSGSLDGGARAHLVELLCSTWRDMEESPAESGSVVVLMDVALECSNKKELQGPLIETLARRLRTTSNPAYWAPFAYLLAGTNWRAR